MAYEQTWFAELTDDELLAEVKRLVATERRATAALVRSLMELDARRLYLAEGCSSLFAYCTQVLHLSEGGAYNRIEAARTARRYPAVLIALEEGAVTLTTIRLLAPHLTPDNASEVLAGARHKSKRDVEALIASMNPQGDTAVPRHGSPATAAMVTPIAPDRYRMQVTITGGTYEKLRRIRDLIRHSVPNGDPAEIVDRALTLLLEDLERRRFAATTSPRPTCASGGRSRHIPAAIKRQVWQRDEGQCAFVGKSGRCTERAFLEYHHVDPYALGGAASADNIQLRCRAHNQYEASQFFWWDAPEVPH